ncbi:MAG: GGDEF domain-containing protein, partial [Candidatus Omnitrophica bacterium]|nr:GGDEF domain-containing protein [Candidatus Omnitrophota bacterium]
DPGLSPEERIAQYRVNLQTMTEIDSNVQSLEDFAGQINRFSMDFLHRVQDKNNPMKSVAFTWGLMLAIIGFLAALSAAAFVVWRKQLKAFTDTKEINMTPPERRVEVQQQLLQSATTDRLTGLYNQAHFKMLLKSEMKSASLMVPVRNLAVIMMDIDFFKRINDTFGHADGDRVLKTLAAILKSHIRRADIACRYGGEEFILMLPGASADRGYDIAERIRKAIEGREFLLGENETPHQVTASFGTTIFDGKETPDELVRRVDKALYEAKNSGRNTVKRT